MIIIFSKELKGAYLVPVGPGEGRGSLAFSHWGAAAQKAAPSSGGAPYEERQTTPGYSL